MTEPYDRCQAPFAYAAPRPAEPALDRVTELLARYNRPLMIALGLVFGIWFLLKALAGFGVIQRSLLAQRAM